MKPHLDELANVFRTTIKGTTAASINVSHDGSIGHWIQSKYGVSPDSDPGADWKGYELKTGRTKTTFGDWSPSSWIFPVRGKNALHPGTIADRDEFLKVFGTPLPDSNPKVISNPAKYRGRLSWSGEVVPKIREINRYGQKLEIDDGGSITATYYHDYDKRPDKASIVPHQLHSGRIKIAQWNEEKMRKHIDEKFGRNGWVKFHVKNGIFSEMWIGGPMTYNGWLELVRNGDVFFDSGMYQGNPRPYCQWRASNTLWRNSASAIID